MGSAENVQAGGSYMKRFFCIIMIVFCLMMCGSAAEESVEETVPSVQESAEEVAVTTPIELSDATEMTTPDRVEEETVPAIVEEETLPQIIAPNAATAYQGRGYSEVVAEFLDAGFVSVRAQETSKGKVSLANDEVVGISVNGDSSFKKGASFNFDAEVIITYFRQTKAKLPISSNTARTANYQMLLKQLYEAGFTNITAEEIYDLDPAKYVNNKTSIVVSVNGKTEFNKNDEADVDVPIKVTVHFPKDQHSVKINIDFLTNLFFNKYSVNLSFDGEKSVTLTHGEDKILEYQRPAGTYILKFESANDTSITGELIISVSGDTEASCDISCNSDCVEVENIEFDTVNQIGADEVELTHSVRYYLRRDYNECVRLLEKLGFTNVQTQMVTDTLWGATKPEQVTRITIDGNDDFEHGEVFRKDAEIAVYYHVPKVEFSKVAFTVTEDDPLIIPFYVAEGDSLEDVTIKVENKEYLKQDDTYFFTAITPGETKVAAYYKDMCLAECVVTVELRIIPISVIIIAEPERNVVVGSTFKIDYKIEPADANYTDVTYEMSESILEQLENGMLYSNAAGNTVITIKQDGRELGMVTICAEEVPVERIAFSEENFSVGAGRAQQLLFSLYPENATCIGLEVTSSNPKIATVEFDEKGAPAISVTGVKTGNATITVKASNKVVAKKQITVTEVVPEAMNVKIEAEKIYIGDTGTIGVEYTPEDTTNQKVTLKSSAPNIFKINWDGTYQAVSAGKATITATHAKGVVGTLEIEVLPVEVERFNVVSDWDESKPFYKNSSMTLKAEIIPENATDKTITWTSSDESVATVSNKGVVKAISVGTAKITAESSNGLRKTYSIEVPVSPQKFRVSATISMKSNNSVGGSWTKGFEVDGETIYSGGTVSIMPGEYFGVRAWAEENDSNPDSGSFYERMELTNEMCTRSFTIEGEFNVRENGGRYRGNIAVWTVKFTFTPVN